MIRVKPLYHDQQLTAVFGRIIQAHDMPALLLAVRRTLTEPERYDFVFLCAFDCITGEIVLSRREYDRWTPTAAQRTELMEILVVEELAKLRQSGMRH